MATALEDFGPWLVEKLQELNTDECVFGSYIQGILDSDETTDEKREALREILSEIIQNETEINDLCQEIFEKWLLFKPKEPLPPEISSEEVDTKLVKLLESQSLSTTKQRQYTEEEKKLREAILSQYSQLTDDEAEEDPAPTPKHPVGDGKENGIGIEKNLNSQTVQQAEKIKREQARLESQKKKEKDKEDRDKQKQQKEEKKEKRKTQKGERRR